VSGLTKKVLADGHDVSILVTCAGIQRRHPAEKFPDSDWDEVAITIALKQWLIQC
jgi:2-deoxy-D-gluconate 3-dehydrogenase